MALGSRSFGLGLVLLTCGVIMHCTGDGYQSDGGVQDGGIGDVNRDELQTMPDVFGSDSGDAGPGYSELCGVVTCVPDDPTSCSSGGAMSVGMGGEAGAPVMPLPTGGQGGVTGTNGGASGDGSGAAGAGGAAGDGAGAVSGAGGVSSGMGGAPAGGNGGSPQSGGGSGNMVFPDASCQVVSTEKGPRAQCMPAGSGDIDAPCFATPDCQAGLACVTDGAAGRCLPFCCAGDDACTHGTYCAERTLAEDGGGGDLKVPVCVPADDCNLNEPYPCTGVSCSCPEGKACMVVRADGTTTCAEPGNGEVGDPCPCAWGHVCSQASLQCVLLCETSRADYYCGNAKCQASAELPEGWGVCVLPEPDAAAR